MSSVLWMSVIGMAERVMRVDRRDAVFFDK
mgnify:CR=1 FL=1